jgi:PPIC-type PPIASE domain
MKKLLREPMVHFIALGALLFALNAVVAERKDRNPATIVVSTAQIDKMSAVFERTWRRAPTPEESKRLVDDYVREEVLYREGLALGLDRDDSLIRRRVRQRVEFLAEGLSGVPEADDAALQAYLDQHRDRYDTDARFGFRQVYLGTTAADAAGTARLLARLNALGDSEATAELGLATQLDARVDATPVTDIARTFGKRFATSLAALPVGQWQGPVPSDYGVHFVRVGERIASRPSALADVREILKRDWTRDAMAAASEKHYAGLRARYAVRVESPRIAAAQ